MQRVLTVSVVLTTAVLSAAQFQAPHHSTDGLQTSHISVHDERFVDELGRERYFRGVNVVYKDPPFLPHTHAFHANLSFAEADVDLLSSLGVNLIRLGVMWPGVVPRIRGQVDHEYLARVRAIVAMCRARNPPIYVWVEPHQDELHPRFCGEGAPSWWVQRHTETVDFPVPVQDTPFNSSMGDRTCERVPGVPALSCPTRSQCDEHSSFSYIWTHDAARAYQALWTRGAAEFGEYWATVAAEFAGIPNVLGGELWNEPFPGDVFDNSTAPGLHGSWRDNALADKYNLAPFYANVTAAIRARVPSASSFAIAYEPSWPVGDQDIRPESLLSPTSGFDALPGETPVYAFHYYVPPCEENFTRYLDARLADARRLGAVPYLSEMNLGASDHASQFAMAHALTQVETRGVAYTGWQYKSYSGSLVNGTCTGCWNSFFHTNGSANEWMHRAMARPLAQAVAGSAVSAALLADDSVFTLEYAPNATAENALTEIVVPHLWSGGKPVISTSAGAEVVTREYAGRHITKGVAYRGWTVVTVSHTQMLVHAEGDKSDGSRVRVTVRKAGSM